MTTYVIKTVQEFDGLSALDLIPFVDGTGRLDVRIEGEAATRPFAVLNVLRAAGFLHTHSWVEPGTDVSPLALRVTAALPELVTPDCGERERHLVAVNS